MKHKLIEAASGNEVKPGMTILDFRNDIYKVVSFTSPRHAGSSGRVNVVSVEDTPAVERSYYPSVFGLKIVEAPNDPFDN